MGVVTLVGSIAMLDLKLPGLSRGHPVWQPARHLPRRTLAALLVIVPTGLLSFVAHAAALPAFRAGVIDCGRRLACL